MRHFALPFALLLLFSLLCLSCVREERHYVVGVSQCSEDIWRDKLNEELRMGEYYHSNLTLHIASANDNDRRQIAQIDEFIAQKVDLLIVSPNQLRTISPAIERAYAAKIPVILFDRKTDSKKYTAFIGADNYEIGRTMGRYLALQLGGRGKVVEVMGLKGSSPAIERHRGMMEALKAYPEVKVVGRCHADWLEGAAQAQMAKLLATLPDFDAVVGQNDRMAVGARKAVEAAGRGHDIIYMGIDALPVAGGGLELVRDGRLRASYIYPTRGDLVVRLAMNILEGKPYARDNYLKSALVTKENASLLLMQDEELRQQSAKLAVLRGRVDTYFTQYQHQKVYLAFIIIIFLLILGVLFGLYRYISMKHRLVEAATQARLQFFTNLSHEFRTPLTLIIDPIDRLLDDTPLDDQQRSLLQLARRNVRVLLRLVTEILDLRKVQNGKMQLVLTEFDLREQLQEWVNGFMPAFERRGLLLHLDLPDALPMRADAEKTEQMFNNLLSNAIKFTPRGGTISVRATLEDGQVRIVVADTGVGIAKSRLSHVFDRFYQINAHDGKGTGIGLAIVKAFAELQGGSVSVESREGEGARFCIVLPCRQEGDSEADNKAETTPPAESPDHRPEPDFLEPDEGTSPTLSPETDRLTNPTPPEERPLVLIVDDNEEVREYVQSLLVPHYDILTAVDGEEGLSKALARVPDAIIADVSMPGMSGIDLCRRLKADAIVGHIPILLLTAHAQHRLEAYDCGADAYLLKPFSSKVLLARVQNLLSNRQRLKLVFSGEDNLPPKPADADEAFVRAFRDKVQQHMADPDLNVETIAAEMGMSRVQLYRKLKALTGNSPVELIRTTRLRRADLMLRQGGRTIAEVSYEVGFSSPSYFSKCFKEHFGRSPGTKPA